ncbi:MAG: hypothetical protein JNM40_01175 [Myxococcales bacterium]|nr:hypothetical protein [Myxococcales bacterium]
MAPLFPALVCAVLCLVLFTTIAGVDGLYFHLYRYRLYERPASLYEHKLHTLNAVLFVPQVVLLFCLESSGLWLWLSLLLFVVTVAVEVTDVLCEEASRRDLGGLTRIEYLMHFLMAGLRFGWVMPLLFGRPAQAWSLSQTAIEWSSLWLLIVGASISLPAVVIAAIHVVLAARRVPASA